MKFHNPTCCSSVTRSDGPGLFNVGGSPGLSVLSSPGAVNSSQPGVNLSSIVGQVPTALAAALVIPLVCLHSVCIERQHETNCIDAGACV